MRSHLKEYIDSMNPRNTIHSKNAENNIVVLSRSRFNSTLISGCSFIASLNNVVINIRLMTVIGIAILRILAPLSSSSSRRPESWMNMAQVVPPMNIIIANSRCSSICDVHRKQATPNPPIPVAIPETRLACTNQCVCSLFERRISHIRQVTMISSTPVTAKPNLKVHASGPAWSVSEMNGSQILACPVA